MQIGSTTSIDNGTNQVDFDQRQLELEKTSQTLRLIELSLPEDEIPSLLKVIEEELGCPRYAAVAIAQLPRLVELGVPLNEIVPFLKEVSLAADDTVWPRFVRPLVKLVSKFVYVPGRFTAEALIQLPLLIEVGVPRNEIAPLLKEVAIALGIFTPQAYKQLSKLVESGVPINEIALLLEEFAKAAQVMGPFSTVISFDQLPRLIKSGLPRNEIVPLLKVIKQASGELDLETFSQLALTVGSLVQLGVPTNEIVPLLKEVAQASQEFIRYAYAHLPRLIELGVPKKEVASLLKEVTQAAGKNTPKIYAKLPQIIESLIKLDVPKNEIAQLLKEVAQVSGRFIREAYWHLPQLVELGVPSNEIVSFLKEVAQLADRFYTREAYVLLRLIKLGLPRNEIIPFLKMTGQASPVFAYEIFRQLVLTVESLVELGVPTNEIAPLLKEVTQAEGKHISETYTLLLYNIELLIKLDVPINEIVFALKEVAQASGQFIRLAYARLPRLIKVGVPLNEIARLLREVAQEVGVDHTLEVYTHLAELIELGVPRNEIAFLLKDISQMWGAYIPEAYAHLPGLIKLGITINEIASLLKEISQVRGGFITSEDVKPPRNIELLINLGVPKNKIVPLLKEVAEASGDSIGQAYSQLPRLIEVGVPLNEIAPLLKEISHAEGSIHASQAYSQLPRLIELGVPRNEIVRFLIMRVTGLSIINTYESLIELGASINEIGLFLKEAEQTSGVKYIVELSRIIESLIKLGIPKHEIFPIFLKEFFRDENFPLFKIIIFLEKLKLYRQNQDLESIGQSTLSSDEINRRVQELAEQLLKTRQTAVEIGLPTVGGKIGGEEDCFDVSHPLFHLFNIEYRGEILEENGVRDKTKLIIFPPGSNYQEVIRFIDLLIYFGILKPGSIFRHHIALSGRLSEESKYIALGLHSLSHFTPDFPKLLDTNVGFQTVSPITEGGGAFTDIHQTGKLDRFDFPLLRIISVADTMELAARYVLKPSDEPDYLEGWIRQNVLGPALAERFEYAEDDLLKVWDQLDSVKQGVINGLSKILSMAKKTHHDSLRAATLLTWAMQAETDSPQRRIFEKYQKELRSIYEDYNLQAALDNPWVGQKWSGVYLHLAPIDEIRKTDAQFSSRVSATVAKYVDEIEAIALHEAETHQNQTPNETLNLDRFKKSLPLFLASTLTFGTQDAKAHSPEISKLTNGLSQTHTVDFNPNENDVWKRDINRTRLNVISKRAQRARLRQMQRRGI